MNKTELAKQLNEDIQKLNDTNVISDGYHTFGELYKHRIFLWIALCRQRREWCWKTKKN